MSKLTREQWLACQARDYRESQLRAKKYHPRFPFPKAGIMDYAEQFSSTFEDYDEKDTE